MDEPEGQHGRWRLLENIVRGRKRLRQKGRVEGLFDMDHLSPIIVNSEQLKNCRWTRLDRDGWPMLQADPFEIAAETSLDPDHEGLTYFALRDHGLCHARAARMVNVWRMNGYTPKDVVQILEDWVNACQSWQRRIDGSIELAAIAKSECDRFLTCAVVWRKANGRYQESSLREAICQNICCNQARRFIPSMFGEDRWKTAI